MICLIHSFAVRRRLRGRRQQALPLLAFSFLFLTAAIGCNRLGERAKQETVYVVTEKTYLRDRVAPVATRTAQVSNGEALKVVQRIHRFYEVKTARGETGWIEDHLVIDQPTYDKFLQLNEEHQHDPIVAKGILSDLAYLHLTPGRDSERFYLLPANDRLQLLVRTSVPRPNQPGVIPPSNVPVSKTAASSHAGKSMRAAEHEKRNVIPGAPLIRMEDWWLVRDQQGRVGWLQGRRFDVDVPDEIAQYSEGQKMVGAYVLTRTYDPDSSLPDKQVPVYVAVLNPYMEGLPYDFNQVRVFTWDVKKHRYETAFRQRDLEGYLPVEISQEKIDRGEPVPVYTIHIANGAAAAAPNEPAAGGAATPLFQAPVPPAQRQTERFALEGGLVRKIFPVTEKPVSETAHRKPARTAHRGKGRRERH